MEEDYKLKFWNFVDFVIGFFGGIFLNLVISTYFLYLYADTLNRNNGLIILAIIIFLIELVLLTYAMLRSFKLERKNIGYGIATMLAFPAMIILLLIISLF